MVTTKRCDLTNEFYEKLENFVSQHTNPSFHHISYWINICFRIGVVCIENKHVSFDKLLFNDSYDKGTVSPRAVSIDPATYEDLKNFVRRRGKGGRQLINFWLNIACEVGFDCIVEKKVDLTNYLLGGSPSEYLIRKDNLKVLPVEPIDKKTLQPSSARTPIPTEMPSEAVLPKSTPKGKVRSQNYDPQETEELAKMFDLR